MVTKKKRVLTGDRPTGPLHLGHFVGSLKSRIELQNSGNYDQFVMVADVQALTDNADNPEKVRQNVLQVALDYLAVGIDPKETTLFIQSLIPQIPELTMYYLNLVTWSRVQNNPTVREEIKQKGMTDVLAGFLIYPVNQAADITAFKAELVPVGKDQEPMLELARDIVRNFNRIYKKEVLIEPKAQLSATPRLPGIDGKAKMSKSLGNGISLGESEKDVEKKVKQMFTDPLHTAIDLPGRIEGNTVFTYLDAFDPDKEEVEALKAHYQRGGLGDMVVKTRLMKVLKEFLGPIREKRQLLAQRPDDVMDLLFEGSKKARCVAEQTLLEVREAMLLNY